MFQSALRMRGLFNSRSGRGSSWAISFQSALRMRGLFNQDVVGVENWSRMGFQSALRMRGLFNAGEAAGEANQSNRFQSALRMRGLFNQRPVSGTSPAKTFQSALRMRGLFNPPRPGARRLGRGGFNPPCGCVAFSTRTRTHRRRFRSRVSIRLADAWPFQPGSRPGRCRQWSWFQSALRMRGLFNSGRAPGGVPGRCFNPPCGCVAFSTASNSIRRSAHSAFQSALRMRGLFNGVSRETPGRTPSVSIRLADAWPFQRNTGGGVPRQRPVSIRLADAWPFQLCSSPTVRRPPPRFQSALRMRGLFNLPRGVGLRQSGGGFQSALRMRGLFNNRCARDGCSLDSWFQSALRMRGLFNHGEDAVQILVAVFQSALRMRGLFNGAINRLLLFPHARFNPPCGCVAFSTRFAPKWAHIQFQVSIRLADAWPFQLNAWRSPPPPPPVSIRLADAWPFQLKPDDVVPLTVLGFNPPCGCVAFSTPALATASGRHGEALLREARPERRAAP